MQTQTPFHSWHLLFWILAGILLSGCSVGSNYSPIKADDPGQEGIAIQGFSPVSYFESGRAEQGDKKYSYAYKEQLYFFTSQEQIEIFRQNPDRYVPRYGEYCPYSLALGRRVGIDPSNFKIHNDQLLLFHNAIELSTVDVDAQQETFKEADRQFELFSLEF